MPQTAACHLGLHYVLIILQSADVIHKWGNQINRGSNMSAHFIEFIKHVEEKR